MNVAVVVPMLGRAHRVVPLVASIRSTAPTARILFATSEHDTAVRQTIDRVGCERITVAWHPRGDYARKINHGYRHTTEELIFCGADDLLFHPGWLQAATAALAPGIGVVGTNDLGSPRVLAGLHATHCLITRAYADRFGTIDRPGQVMHEGYVHEWVDDELVETAKHRHAWAFAADSHVEHLHPGWGKAPTDAMYRLQGKRMRQGKPLFQTRQALWT